MPLTILGLLFAATSVARADTTYRISGTLPDDVTITGDMVGQVAIGESWSAMVTLDKTTTDNVAESDFGSYVGAVLQANLRFSGGYSTSLQPVFLISDVFVFDNFFGVDGVFADIQRIDTNESLGAGVTTQILGTLSSDSLPEFGTPAFVQNLATGDIVLDYLSPGGGTVYYESLSDGRLEVVPEPATIALLPAFALWIVGTVWRRGLRFALTTARVCN